MPDIDEACAPAVAEEGGHWGALFFVGAVAVLAIGFALTFFGVGADLRRPVPLTVWVRALDVPSEVASSVKAGDPVFTDPAGMRIATITDVKSSPMTTTTVDAAGAVHETQVAGLEQLDLTLEGQGRSSEGFTALDTQVLSVGQRFVVYTDNAFIEANVMSFSAK